MSHSEQLFRIVAGPCKRGILKALGNAKSRQKVRIKYHADGSRRNVRADLTILMLGHQDDSGHSWNFRGVVEDPKKVDELIHGNYNSQARIGYFTVIS